jgi:hypothetical protein
MDLPAARPASTPSLPAHVGSPDRRVAHREWIGGAVKTLVSLVSGDWPTDPRLEAEMGFMWANDLECFPQDVIEAAITAYRRTETRKPAPAAIIALCRKHMPRPTAVAMLEPPERRTSPEERERIQAIVEANFPELRRIQRSGDE